MHEPEHKSVCGGGGGGISLLLQVTMALWPQGREPFTGTAKGRRSWESGSEGTGILEGMPDP